MAPPRAPPELMAELVAEILLRLPPGEPACLVRASLVCKTWRRLLADPGFPRRYREFHGAPPLLGFLHNVYTSGCPTYRFVPTTATSSFPLPEFDCGRWRALDCRHGRVLLDRWDARESLVVWDPITGNRRRLHVPDIRKAFGCNSAAVLCAAGGCDHLNCHGGPFRVVFVGTYQGFIEACVYSSETGAWSTPSSVHLSPDMFIDPKRGVLIGDEIYFTLRRGGRIIKYDLGNHSLSVIDPPNAHRHNTALMVTENNSLGLASISGSKLYLWSRKVKPEGVVGWVQCRVVELKTLIPSENPCYLPTVIGFAEGAGVIFLTRDVRVFMMELKSGRVRKVSEGVTCYSILPFASFYTPGT